jgi:nucleotide-binding universal stress UspA family protein
MKHILVPVDLSKNSKEALRYAVHLAKKNNATITIVHFYSLLMKAVIHTTEKGYTEKNPEKWIQKRIKKIKAKQPGINVSFSIMKGDAEDSIRRAVGTTGADLLIMGCQGAEENTKTYLGATSCAIIMTAKIPVIIIPPRYRFQGLKHIAFAAIRSYVKDEKTLAPLQYFIHTYSPHIQFLSLGEEHPEMPEGHFSFMPLVEATTRYGNDSFNASINEYIGLHEVDLLCVIRRKKGFLEKTIGPKRTLASKLNIAVPVLVLVGAGH